MFLFFEFGELERMSIVKKGKYNLGFFVNKSSLAILSFWKSWYLFYKKESIRLTPLDLSDEDLKVWNAFILKLSGLPLFYFE